MNGLSRFTVMEGTNTVWEIRTSSYKGTKIVYGELPKEGNRRASQVVPARGIDLADIRGKTVTVRVHYTYDRAFAVCQNYFEKSMQIPNAEPAAAPQ